MPSNTVQDRSILAGLSRVRKALQAAIEWFSGGVSTGLAGSVTKVDFSTGLTAVQVGDTLTITAAGGGGTVTTVDGFSPDMSGNVNTVPMMRRIAALRAY